MAIPWAAFHDAWEVLAFGAIGALLAMETDAGAAARYALVASPAMLTEAGAATGLALFALLAVKADAGAAARRALGALLAVLTLLPYPPLDWMRRRGIRRCRSCWGCQIHGGEL